MLVNAEAEMNTAFNTALKMFLPDEKDSKTVVGADRMRQIEWQKRILRDLKTSQSAWLAYRDSSCRSISDFYEDGSGEPTAVASCKLGITTARTQFLRDNFGGQK